MFLAFIRCERTITNWNESMIELYLKSGYSVRPLCLAEVSSSRAKDGIRYLCMLFS